MATPAEIEKIQNYLRASAHGQYDAVALPPFTLFFHPTDTLKYFNYAIPDGPVVGPADTQLAELRHEFLKRGRTARFEFFEAYAPQLPAVLQSHGFHEEARQWSMLCTSQTLREVPEVPGLEVFSLGAHSSAQDMHDFMLIQRVAFGPDEPAEVSPQEVQRGLADAQKGRWHAFMARIAGQPAGAASFGEPIGGVTEIAGIATHPNFRRRGIAARLTHLAVQAAFAQNVQTVCLTAADAQAGRVYERVGFQPFSTMLAYIDNSE